MLRLRFRHGAIRHRAIGDRFIFDPSLSIVLALTLLVAGCGGRSDYATTADARVAVPPQAHFRSALAAPSAEMEGDGLPVQRAPLVERTRFRADPSEPFSPNYGAQPPRDKSVDAAPRLPSTQPRLSVPAKDDDHAHLNRSQSASQPASQSVASEPAATIPPFSVSDLPDDLPPDFRERLIVMNQLR